MWEGEGRHGGEKAEFRVMRRGKSVVCHKEVVRRGRGGGNRGGDKRRGAERKVALRERYNLGWTGEVWKSMKPAMRKR